MRRSATSEQLHKAPQSNLRGARQPCGVSQGGLRFLAKEDKERNRPSMQGS